MGDTFWHVHHYCWALLNANRAAHTAMPPQQRKHMYKTAIADSIYVLNQAPRDFVLLPEIYLRMGQFFLAADEPVDALIHFDKSRQAKPDYWPAYLELSKLNVTLKRHQDAINVLKSGLAIMPDDPRLTEALASLTAAKPEPTPKRPDRTARTAGK